MRHFRDEVAVTQNTVIDGHAERGDGLDSLGKQLYAKRSSTILNTPWPSIICSQSHYQASIGSKVLTHAGDVRNRSPPAT